LDLNPRDFAGHRIYKISGFILNA